jgi:hypothetical protein
MVLRCPHGDRRSRQQITFSPERRPRPTHTPRRLSTRKKERTVSQTNLVAIGSGLGGLTATKALKHSQLNITDALVFLTRITAQGTSYVVHQTSLWVQVIPATAVVATAVGVLITLSVAVVGELNKRVAAQARCWWTARIENATSAMRTIVARDVKAIAAKASEEPDGCRQALMGTGADHIITAPRDVICHRGLRSSRPIAKGWS